ncbi:unnamed protein product, partial [marine sediment metagenome]
MKDLETTMSGFLEKLKATNLVFTQHDSAGKVYTDILSGLQETFAGFDTLSIEEKRGRIEMALSFVK